MVKHFILLFLLLAGFANAEENPDKKQPYRDYDGLAFETDLDFSNIYGSIYFGNAYVWDYFNLGGDLLNIRVVKDGDSHRISTNALAGLVTFAIVMNPVSDKSEDADKSARFRQTAFLLLNALNPTIEFFPLVKFNFPLSISGGYNFDWFALSPEHLVNFSTKMGLNLYFHLGPWWRLSALALYQVTDTYDLERGWKFRLSLGVRVND